MVYGLFNNFPFIIFCNDRLVGFLLLFFLRPKTTIKLYRIYRVERTVNNNDVFLSCNSFYSRFPGSKGVGNVTSVICPFTPPSYANIPDEQPTDLYEFDASLPGLLKISLYFDNCVVQSDINRR